MGQYFLLYDKNLLLVFFVNDDHKTKINNESFLYNTESPNIETTIVEPLKVTIKNKNLYF